MSRESKYIDLLSNPSDVDLKNAVVAAQDNVLAKNILAGKTQFLEFDTDFTYSLDQKANQEADGDSPISPIIEDIKSIETFTNIKLNLNTDTENSKYSQTIGKNESIVFECPELTTDKIYSSYIRYFYRIDGTGKISADSTYELKGNDFIIFCKHNDSNQRYSYTKYGAGTLICPSFDLDFGHNLTGDESRIVDHDFNELERLHQPS